MEPISFLHIQGRINKGNQYKPRPGFETLRIPTCYNSESHPCAPSGYTIALVDSAGKQYWESAAVLQGGFCNMPDAWLLSGYIPLAQKPGFYEVRFYNQVIHREPIAAEPPVVRITEWRPDKKLGFIAWESTNANRKLYYSVACIVGNRTYPLLLNSQETSLEFDLSKIPGGTAGRISIRVSDGCRSGVAISEPFPIEQKPPVLSILQPADNSIFDATQPITVSGIARDASGTNLPFSGLQWQVDDGHEPIGSNLGQLVLSPLSPGAHRIRLVYPENNQLFETGINITVNKLQGWELAWNALFSADLSRKQ